MVVPSSGANLSLPATLEIIVRRIADARSLGELPGCTKVDGDAIDWQNEQTLSVCVHQTRRYSGHQPDAVVLREPSVFAELGGNLAEVERV